MQIDHKYMNSTASEKGAIELNSDKKLWIGNLSVMRLPFLIVFTL